MKIRTGDLVLIMSGKDKGKQGTVLRVLASKNHVVVDGINMRTRHIKKTVQAAGQRIQYEASLDASKVMIVDAKTKKPSRIGFRFDAKTGRKNRIAKASGDVIVKTAKAVAKKTAGTQKDPASAQPASETGKPANEAAKPAGRQAFWKRSATAKGGDAALKDANEQGGGSAALPTAHRSQGG